MGGLWPEGGSGCQLVGWSESADTIAVESATDWVDTQTVQMHRIWTPKPDHRDNHWLDATKMAALGCKLAYVEKRDAKKRAPRVSYH